jgi:hypothetical protein
MLKFLLDVYAFQGYRDNEVGQLLYEGGVQAFHISKILHEAAETGGFDGAPWEEKNLHKYLIPEEGLEH